MPAPRKALADLSPAYRARLTRSGRDLQSTQGRQAAAGHRGPAAAARLGRTAVHIDAFRSPDGRISQRVEAKDGSVRWVQVLSEGKASKMTKAQRDAAWRDAKANARKQAPNVTFKDYPKGRKK